MRFSATWPVMAPAGASTARKKHRKMLSVPTIDSTSEVIARLLVGDVCTYPPGVPGGA